MLESQYALKTGEYKELYNTLIWYLVIGVIFSILIVSLIFTFLNRNYLNHKRKELAILYSLGYSTSFIQISIFVETIVLYTSYFACSLLLLQMSYQLFLSKFIYADLFTRLFSSENLFALFSVYVGVALLSSIWGVSSVKKNKLIDYLK